MCLPLLSVCSGPLWLALNIRLTLNGGLGAKTLPVWISVRLLEQPQIDAEYLLDIIVLGIRLLLEL